MSDRKNPTAPLSSLPVSITFGADVVPMAYASTTSPYSAASKAQTLALYAPDKRAAVAAKLEGAVKVSHSWKAVTATDVDADELAEILGELADGIDLTGIIDPRGGVRLDGAKVPTTVTLTAGDDTTTVSLTERTFTRKHDGGYRPAGKGAVTIGHRVTVGSKQFDLTIMVRPVGATEANGYAPTGIRVSATIA